MLVVVGCKLLLLFVSVCFYCLLDPGPRIQQIVGLDEQNQILTTNIWLNMKWWDPFMQWNSSEHNNIQVEDRHLTPDT